MNNKTNYALVGLFVIVGFVFIALFAYYLAKPTDEVAMKKYVIYFNESVLGLNLNSPVKYRGIDVGKVVKLGINPKNSEQVRVVISVNKETPIKTSTVAKLTAQGITGLSYINLSLGDKNSPLLTTPPPGERYPVIRSIPSFFESFQTSFGNIYNKVSKTLDHVDRLLDERNQKEFARLLQESTQFVKRLNKMLNDRAIADLHATLAHLHAVSAQIDTTIPKFNALIEHSIVWEKELAISMQQIVHSYMEIQKTTDAIGNAFRRGDFDMRGIANEFIPALNKSLNALNGLLNEMHETIRVYKRSPRDIFFKETRLKKAPGEQ